MKPQQSLYSTQFTGQWEWIPTINEEEGPSARCGHTLTVHGKQLDHITSLQNRINDRNMRNKGENNNHKYSNKHNHLGNVHGKLLVTFGESSLLASREYLDDMYLLDLSTLKWAKILGKNVLNEYRPYIKSNFNPVARADHAAVSFGDNFDRCLLFGGKCKDTYLDDVIIVRNICNFPINDIEQEIYENHFNQSNYRFGGGMNNNNNNNNSKHSNMPKQHFTDNPLKIESIHFSKGPCGRRGSSLAPWKEGSFLLFGGQRGSLFFNDLWGLDLHKQGWIELSTRRNPMERAFHSAFVDSQQQMLLLGGVRDTQANPAPADIFKLDLRAGKFFKLGDKDMVPGIGSALSKGHHSSHFLSKNCDLIIFSPQKASTHLLGGNVQSEHCGRCTQIKVFTNNTPLKQDSANQIDKTSSNHSLSSSQNNKKSNLNENDENYPLGTCRPATALLESHKTIKEFKSIGCNNRPLERLFVLGGYNPSKRSCTKKLYSLKFSAEACKIRNHSCTFSQTTIISKTLQYIQQQPQQQPQQEETITDNNNNNNNSIRYNKFNNDRLCNVTPMRVTKKSRLSNINNQLQIKQRDNNNNNNNIGNDNNNGLISPSLTEKPSRNNSILISSKREKSGIRTKKRKKPKKVTIIQTPVRVKPLQAANINTFATMYESSAATQKISGLDPELVSNKPHQRYDDKENNDDDNNNNNHSIIRDHILFGSQQQQQQQEQVINDIKKERRRDDDKNKSVHWQYIERLLLNFDESLLDPETAFILEPHEIIDIIMNALPLIQNDNTLTRVDGPVKVFGDIHGQLGDLMSLFKSFGFPDTNIGDINYYKYIFLGDFVDRGQKSLEVMCLLLSLKIEYPDRVFLLRGNHECHAMNEMYGFYHEINERVYPNIDTLKYLDNDVLNESINLIECDKELNEYQNKQEIRKQKRDKHRQEILLQLQQQGKIDEFHHFQRQFQQNDIFDFDLEFEYIEYSKTEEDEDECSSEYLSDEISSCELNFGHNNNNNNNHNNNNHNKRKKIFKKRKYFRDRTDCITYLVQCIELLFRWLPLSILINNKILCVHGGIGTINNISEIERIERPCDVVCDVQQEMDSEQRKVVDLLWSDPAETDSMTGFEPNKRGVSCVFGSDIVRQFCNINNIDLIIRGHQVVKDGFEYFAGGHLITLFSATNYCNVMDNAGAILCIDEKLNVLPKLVEARQIHPNHNDIHDDDDDDDDDENDNLQWKKLKQFPPSPMRGTTNNDNDDDNNNQDDDDNINDDQQDKHDISDQEFFRSIEQPNVI